MSFKQVLVFIALIMTFSVSVCAQTPGGMNVEELTDTEVAEMWKQAQEQGFTIEQFKTLAIARGIPSTQVNVLVNRINTLGTSGTTASVEQITGDDELQDSNTLALVNESAQEGFTGGESRLEGDFKVDVTRSRIFGVDFFNNPNISFTPNLNLATPDNYQLGPGDKLVINLWGAAENTYNKEVDREGAVRIEGFGPIYVSGMTMNAARKKIEGKLKTMYSGIAAPNSSPYKIHLDVSMVSVRTVSVNIIGEVKVPGTYSLSALSTVLNALYAAGGPTKEGTFRNIKLVRNGQEVTYFDVYKYLMDGSQEGNKTLQDQDVIIVSPFISRITIGGAVKRPGSFELKPEENLKDLLKFVSGFKSDAYRERLILERIVGDRMMVKEVMIANAANESLKDGDLLRVNKIINKFENRIQIRGAVYRPGSYEHYEGITLADLIEKSAGIRDEAFLDRGLVFSTKDGVTKTSESFSLAEVLNGNQNIDLKPNDVITIFNKYDLREEYTLSIDGAVNVPHTMDFIENITIEDLVVMAGGFKDAADVGVIDVFRKIKDNEFETLSKTYKVSSDGSLTIGDNENFTLEPNDKVSVRYLKGYSEQKRVIVNGEINFPGNYTIEMKNERISDLVERAGGLSPYAFLEGASLIRQNPYFKDAAINNVFQNLNETGTDDKNLNNKRSFKVGIDLEKILEEGGKDSKYNLVLQDGDRLEIPSVKETVKVQGEILAPSLIRYDDSNTLKDYINKSGGFSSRAKKAKTYVIYSNGDIASSKNFLFFRSYPKLKPGAIILVPAKPDPRPVTAQEVIGITSSLTTFGLLIDRLAN